MADRNATAPVTMPDDVALRSVLVRGARRGLETFWLLTKIMVPVYVVVSILDNTPVLRAVAEWMRPAMEWWNLPGEAALALILGMVVNLYAAVAVIAYGTWTTAQVTIVGVILGIAHSLVMEGAIVRKMGLSPAWFVPTRIVCGFTAGWIVSLILGGTGS